MQIYTVITENDESQWSDDTGVLYHFPKRYAAMLVPGVKVVYYKGKLKNVIHASSRMSPDPHYFGVATIGQVYADPHSRKGDLFATIENYVRFARPIGIKSSGSYLEVIPPSRVVNHWRDGVRPLAASSYETILGLANIYSQAGSIPISGSPIEHVDDLESAQEGSKTLRFVTTYERDERYRRQAIAIHGLRCKACDEHLGEKYGPYAEGLIHIHHVVPISTFEGPRKIDPATELVPVCPNCHSVIHRKKSATLSIAEVRMMLGKKP